MISSSDKPFDLSNLAQLAPPGPNPAEPAFLRDLREQAVASYRRLGLPTTRHEDWLFTNLDALANAPLHLAGGSANVTAAEAADLGIAHLGGPRLVFIDGRFAPQLSDLPELPDGVVVTSLAQALAQSERFPSLAQHLSKQADSTRHFFTALNTAFFTDGALVHIPRNVAFKAPVHLLLIASSSVQPLASQPRNLIVLERGAQATVVEEYVSLGEGLSFCNAVTELFCGEDAHVEHYLLERENRQALNVSTLAIHQQRASNLASHSVLLGGALVRNNVHPVLAGEGCQSLLNGLFLGSDRQHLDNHMLVEHAQGHCDSRQNYKGILDGHAVGIFTGRIVVHPDAQKTDAKQTNMNLLLSDTARVETRPQLEIYADDVKCTHGASIGQIDEQAVFYLRSRGISAQTARELVIYAFASESLARMKLPAVREALQVLLLARMPQQALLEEVV